MSTDQPDLGNSSTVSLFPDDSRLCQIVSYLRQILYNPEISVAYRIKCYILGEIYFCPSPISTLGLRMMEERLFLDSEERTQSQS